MRTLAANRALYREKFARVLPILAPLLDVTEPDGGFYLWPDVQRDDEAFTRELFATQNLTILPGSYLARGTPAGNPGGRRVRISLVATVDECVAAARRIRQFLEK
jgi:N-succinyldiaminopimelate aminotransferase